MTFHDKSDSKRWTATTRIVLGIACGAGIATNVLAQEAPSGGPQRVRRRCRPGFRTPAKTGPIGCSVALTRV